jgi:predicted nuclease of restriction endonuclease-like RecB superfamily
LLTADLVYARRSKGELKLVKLSPELRTIATELAEDFVALAQAHIGQTREELDEAWASIEVEPRARKLADGLRKLVDDALVFDNASEQDPGELRRAVFETAARQRRDLEDGRNFDRQEVLRGVAVQRELDADSLERLLYADLRSAHVLREIGPLVPRALVEGYDLEQARAVLLRAISVVVRIRNASPASVRALFRKLKFLRLMHRVTREAEAYRIEIDGPYSLFDQVTKYGLALAISLPALTSCGKWELHARLKWGKDQQALDFKLEGAARDADDTPERLPDDVQALLERFRDRDGVWRAEIADSILDLPGVGVCVPDLRFVHRDGREVFLEVLGFWSRDAVFKRVELAERGLGAKILFAASSRLRVSEAVLEDDHAALYVYKGTLSPKAIEEKLDALIS